MNKAKSETVTARKKRVQPKTAAGRVIHAFGGARPLAKILKINPEAVYRWDYSKQRRGSGGTIPSEWHKPILDAAKKNGIRLTAADLVNV